MHTVQIFYSKLSRYFKNMNPSTSLLDVKLHTPQYVAMRSPFLFTVGKSPCQPTTHDLADCREVCAIASRFYSERPELYSQLIYYARFRAGTALISGTKNEEMCAAYLLMQLYPVPAKRWDEDRSWIYLGVGIRHVGLFLPNSTVYLIDMPQDRTGHQSQQTNCDQATQRASCAATSQPHSDLAELL